MRGKPCPLIAASTLRYQDNKVSLCDRSRLWLGNLSGLARSASATRRFYAAPLHTDHGIEFHAGAMTAQACAVRLRRKEPSMLRLKLMSVAIGENGLDRIQSGFRVAIERFGYGCIRRQPLIAESVIISGDRLNGQACVFQ